MAGAQLPEHAQPWSPWVNVPPCVSKVGPPVSPAFDGPLACNESIGLPLGVNHLITRSVPIGIRSGMTCEEWNCFWCFSWRWICLHLLSRPAVMTEVRRSKGSCALRFSVSKMADYLLASFGSHVMFPLLNSCITADGFDSSHHKDLIWPPDAQVGGGRSAQTLWGQIRTKPAEGDVNRFLGCEPGCSLGSSWEQLLTTKN